jgi:hypothetical protein
LASTDSRYGRNDSSLINGEVKAWGPSAAEVFDCNESGAGCASSGAVRP